MSRVVILTVVVQEVLGLSGAMVALLFGISFCGAHLETSICMKIHRVHRYHRG